MVSYPYKDSLSILHLSVWLIGQESWKFPESAVDAGLIPGSSQLRQKSDVGQEIAKFCCL